MTFEHLMDLRYNIGKEEGINIGRNEGINIGEKRGEKKGEEKLSQLYMLLVEQKREEDLKKAMEDKEYRGQLYQEFGLEE